jgi:hypothetical protein
MIPINGLTFENITIDWFKIWRERSGLPHKTVTLVVKPPRGKGHTIQIYVSPTGRSVRVFKNGRELK